MMLKKFLAVFALSLVPAMAAAACGGSMTQTSSVCEDGQTWDAESATCIAPATS